MNAGIKRIFQVKPFCWTHSCAIFFNPFSLKRVEGKTKMIMTICTCKVCGGGIIVLTLLYCN